MILVEGNPLTSTILFFRGLVLLPPLFFPGGGVCCCDCCWGCCCCGCCWGKMVTLSPCTFPYFVSIILDLDGPLLLERGGGGRGSVPALGWLGPPKPSRKVDVPLNSSLLSTWGRCPPSWWTTWLPGSSPWSGSGAGRKCSVVSEVVFSLAFWQLMAIMLSRINICFMANTFFQRETWNKEHLFYTVRNGLIHASSATHYLRQVYLRPTELQLFRYCCHSILTTGRFMKWLRWGTIALASTTSLKCRRWCDGNSF